MQSNSQCPQTTCLKKVLLGYSHVVLGSLATTIQIQWSDIFVFLQGLGLIHILLGI